MARHPNGLTSSAIALAATTIQRRTSINSVAAARIGARSADGCVLIQTIVRIAYAIARRGGVSFDCKSASAQTTSNAAAAAGRMPSRSEAPRKAIAAMKTAMPVSVAQNQNPIVKIAATKSALTHDTPRSPTTDSATYNV